ncbi:MAG: hypothetical protein VX527_11990, partial [Planctomycetota bacterium]|nr:hypothetical protein [Planctomycetota bacterium]
MPRAPRFLASVIASLHHDLRFAPDKTRQRQMDAAEELIAEIRTEQLYPMDFVVYRVTGFRPESGTFDATVVGQALIRDLGAFIQSLSVELDLSMDHPRGQALSLDEVAATLEVDRRTVQRRRVNGLVLHWVRDSQGRRFLGC